MTITQGLSNLVQGGLEPQGIHDLVDGLLGDLTKQVALAAV